MGILHCDVGIESFRRVEFGCRRGAGLIGRRDGHLIDDEEGLSVLDRTNPLHRSSSVVAVLADEMKEVVDVGAGGQVVDIVPDGIPGRMDLEVVSDLGRSNMDCGFGSLGSRIDSVRLGSSRPATDCHLMGGMSFSRAVFSGSA